MKKRIILYFGSFNPIHRGHIALAEWVVEQVPCDELVLVVSPHNPLKESGDLAPELARFEMAELACAHSHYPERIKPSAIEFLLERPSYTIQTLRYLTENYGAQMEFSILMGADILPQLHRWRDYETLLAHYPIYVYPRTGYDEPLYEGQVVRLEGAPLCNYSSTEVRHTLETEGDASTMLTPEVATYIRDHRLWSPMAYLDRLNRQLMATPDDVALRIARGRWYYRRNEWGKALNDFRHALTLRDDLGEVKQYVEQIEEILNFRYKEIYNP